MDYSTKLYATLHPHQALVASQLNHEQFAQHYTQGSNKHYAGKIIFAEIDPDYRNDFFRIDEALKDVVPHKDGRPKATKFISTYRVLEHIELSAIKRIYLATQEGYAFPLEPGEWNEPNDEGFIRIYTEIAPMRLLALSNYNSIDFGKYITDLKNFRSAPTQLYAEVDLNIQEFLDEFEENPFRMLPIRNVHPSVLRDAFYELKRKADKRSKALSLDTSLVSVSYKFIRHGFMVATNGDYRFFAMPSLTEIEQQNYKFWRSM